MIAGVVVMFIGYFIMSSDGQPYGFGTLGLTVGPIILMLGFLIEFVAIFYKSKKEDSAD